MRTFTRSRGGVVCWDHQPVSGRFIFSLLCGPGRGDLKTSTPNIVIHLPRPHRCRSVLAALTEPLQPSDPSGGRCEGTNTETNARMLLLVPPCAPAYTQKLQLELPPRVLHGGARRLRLLTGGKD